MCTTIIKTYIDEKGKEWETIKETCPKCGGAGHIYQNGWQYYSNGACFKCEGKGYILTNRRILTDKEKVAREKAKQRKEEKQKTEWNQNRKTQLEKMNNDDKIEAGFITDTIYCIMNKDSYDIKEQLKTEGSIWSSKFQKWIMDENNANKDKYITIAVNWKDVAKIFKCYEEDPIERIMFDSIDMWQYINNKEKELNIKESKGQFVGSEGDKIEIEITLESIHGYDTQYGYMHINLYKDAQGNIYKWNSKNTLELEKDEYKTIKATIKGHEEYDGQKQTVITRCKIVK